MDSDRVVRRGAIRALCALLSGRSSKPDHEYTAVLLDSPGVRAEARRHREFRRDKLSGIPFYCGDDRRIERVDVEFGAEVDAVEPDQRLAHALRARFSCGALSRVRYEHFAAATLTGVATLDQNSREFRKAIRHLRAARVREFRAVEEPAGSEFAPLVELDEFPIEERSGHRDFRQRRFNPRQAVLAPHLTRFGDFDRVALRGEARHPDADGVIAGG